MIKLKDKILGNKGAKSCVQKSHFGNEAALARERWSYSGNKGTKMKKREHNFFIKLIIVDMDCNICTLIK